MKLARIGAAMLIGILSLAGCGKEGLPDSYVDGSDFQYMQAAQVDFWFPVQKGRDGYYFLQNGFVYYYDQVSDTLLPLCNKAECLHDMEPDETRMKNCNGYINSIYGGDDLDTTGIFYCNGYVYYVVADDGSKRMGLYRVADDGSGRECVYSWPEGTGVFANWIVHRDVMYYSARIYEMGDDAEIATDRFEVFSLDLTDRFAEPESIYTTEEDIQVWEVAEFCAYGNHVYFRPQGTYRQSEEDGDERLFQTSYEYDTEKKTVSAIPLPDGITEEQGRVDVCTFWEGRLLFKIYSEDKELTDTTDVYIADLDGSNASVFMEDVVQGKCMQTDGKYVYLSNGMVFWDLVAQNLRPMPPLTFEAYDGDGRLVDTFLHPHPGSFISARPVGDGGGMYNLTWSREEKELQLLSYDKSEIGSIGGAEIPVKVAARRKLGEKTYIYQRFFEGENEEDAAGGQASGAGI